ncbi:MAG: phosphatase PAP2 family protein [Verrucomicrobia bacterium]|nr:phosphatase PAP2 family protein [Verrucomicrobiota bacterium]
MNSRFSSSILQNRLSTALPVLLFLFVLAGPLVASDRYGLTNRLDSVALLAPPPLEGSAEYKADIASARAVFNERTPGDEARAITLQKLIIFNFTPAIGDFLQPGKFPKTEAFFDNMKPEIKPAIDAPKDHWKRIRPYDVDKKLWLGEPESSFSYPSGHATVGMIQALVLAELFPDKREAILAIGRDFGWARVVIGKHFPTDVYAGRVLAQGIVRELMASPEFQKDLAVAKAELQAALNNSK